MNSIRNWTRCESDCSRRKWTTRKRRNCLAISGSDGDCLSIPVYAQKIRSKGIGIGEDASTFIEGRNRLLESIESYGQGRQTRRSYQPAAYLSRSSTFRSWSNSKRSELLGLGSERKSEGRPY